MFVLCIACACACLSAVRAQDVDTVPGYHRTDDRSGQYVVPGLTWQSASHLHRDSRFDGKVDGHIYAQPLYWRPPGSAAGLLIAATQANIVYALDAATGRVVWRTVLGPPVPRSALPCGNVDPVGVTGTPVIDPAAGKLYVDALVGRQGEPAHLVYGLSLRDGSVLPGWPVDVAAGLRARGMSFDSRVQSERGALVILEGRLFVPYGGYFGDCGNYHGGVVGLRLDSPGVFGGWMTRGPKGGIWAPGGIAVADRALFVATGNTSGIETWADGEAILRLATDLKTPASGRDTFAPADWHRLDDSDLDMGGTNPMPVDVNGRRLIVALGKDGKAYMLDRDHLGGMGGALDVQQVSSVQTRTGPASYPAPNGVYIALHGNGVACPAGQGGAGLIVLQIVAASRGGIRTAWCARVDGAGSPITTTSDGTADRIVWIAGAEGDNKLHGFRGDNGQPVFAGGGNEDRIPGLRHFATILAAGRRLYIAGDNRIYAFSFGP
ncbi:outer membrane protein assembly factor BamB family protein [Paraburkholderia diazotrophica]|nr:PQQ-binding-like beta-propeller repeat protein [Paraburkholderia diazotrophica]